MSTLAAFGVCDSNGSTSSAHGFAGPGGIGGFAETHHFCCVTATGGGHIGSIDTAFTVLGDPGVVNVGLDLDLSSSFFDVNFPNFGGSYVVIKLDVFIGGLLRDFVTYYHQDRIHDSLEKDAPNGRPVESKPALGATVDSMPRLGGLHHRYGWRAAA